MQFENNERELQSEVVAVQNIPIISKILEIICRTTGMGFSAVARVTEERWITCCVLDKIQFGLGPGDELKVETTICNEIRQSSHLVVIDDVDKDELFRLHPTPQLYGFKSYISVPIFRKDGRFFGTLCAVDPNPAKLDTPEVIGLFNLFSDLISFHLGAIEQLDLGESKLLQEREEKSKALELKNAELQQMNTELESFAHIAGHDLQEPLRKIETFSRLILDKDYENLSSGSRHYFDRLMNSVKRMQTLIADLLKYTQLKVGDNLFENVDLNKLIEEFKQNFIEELNQKQARIEVTNLGNAFIIPFQFTQLLQNLIGNSIKFSKPGVDPVIHISGTIETGNNWVGGKLLPERKYLHLTVTDNGIGFEDKYSETIFKIFQRLNGRGEYDGTGIGLSIVKKIVDNHDGFITASGKPNEGAKFEIYIPQS
jgi:signal transduction histidine kinase